MSQEKASETSLSVREFIYLDLPKIQSYLSQIENGLSILLNTVRGEYSETDVEPALKEVVNESLTRAFAGGAVPFLGNAEAEASHRRTAKTTSGGQRVSTQSDTHLTELSVLHHKAFDVVMEKLENKFERFTGRIYLVPVDTIRDLFDNLGSQVPGVDYKQAQLGFASISQLGVSNVVYCEGQGRVLSAFMQNEFFTISQATFPYIYGIPSEHHFTLVGIKGKSKAAMPGVAPKGVGISQAGKLTGALGQFGKVIDDMFGSGERIYPLALYREL